jgi:predicted acetyltransferase
MSYDIRPITRDEFTAFEEVDSIAFGYTPDERESERTREYMEFDRTLAVFDGTDIVGTTCIFSFDMSLPGGSLPTAGVSWVSVRPTHTRRGILTMMMRRQLNDVLERGEAIAALWASESLIYGRFGYGLAAQNAALSIERDHAALAFDHPAPGTIRLVERDEALTNWPECHERARLQRPGVITRSPKWWQFRKIPDKRPDGGRKRFLAQYEEDGEVRGFARYEWAMNWGDDGKPVVLRVQDLVAETPGAYTALWKLVLGTDLVTVVEASNRPIDEPLYHMLADPRRLKQRLHDSLWIRLVDVPKALEGRRYTREGTITMAIHDDFCEWVGGKYTLETGAEGGRCTRTTGPADITLHARDLGAVYLGGTRLATLAAAGRVNGSPEAIALADAMFAWEPLPCCPEIF